MKTLLALDHELAPFIAKEERRNASLDRWVSVQLSVKIHVTGVDEHRHVTKAPGQRRTHLVVRVPEWLALAIVNARRLWAVLLP